MFPFPKRESSVVSLVPLRKTELDPLGRTFVTVK
jgi:hypothetical protein